MVRKYTDIHYVQAGCGGGGEAILVSLDTCSSSGACEGRKTSVDEHRVQCQMRDSHQDPTALKFQRGERRGQIPHLWLR